ncbi:MAG: 4Fe-4S ferredoxin [Phycisphaerae bacterium]|jgi:molybdopterin-containing oxidoreductase family iron-sulfur binding subunit|nr:MAG: 4Fe-4S ferredoxin [Phycisphaerae bacterium]
MGMNRREFVRATALVGAGIAGATALVVKDRATASKTRDPVGPKTIRSLTVLNNVPKQENEDLLIRMQRELVKAMSKPVEQRKWVMVIDTRKCVGCHACTIGCVAENKLPPGVVYRPVVTEEFGEFPNVQLRFTPRPCMQCEQPPCVPVCPVSATWRRPDGITVIDYDKCIGCRYCLTACPYGARTSDFGAYYTDNAARNNSNNADHAIAGPHAAWEDQPNFEYAKNWDRSGHQSPMGNARKCHFCLHRLEVGELPTCVTTCIGRATYFGDHNDPDSLVSGLIAKNNCQTLLPHKGTKPRVFYIV